VKQEERLNVKSCRCCLGVNERRTNMTVIKEKKKSEKNCRLYGFFSPESVLQTKREQKKSIAREV